MSQLVLQNAKIFFHGANLQTDLNQVDVNTARAMLNATVFGDTFMRNRAGIASVTASITGFFNAGTNPDKPYPTFLDQLGSNDRLVSVFPTTIEEGSTTNKGIAFNASQSRFNLQGRHGDLLGFDAAFAGRGHRLLEVTCLKDASVNMETASQNWTAFNVGAVSASQYLYAGLHVLENQGTSPTLDLKIQSDDAAGFGSATDRVTFTQATTRGSQYATRVAGAITDTYWRASWTLGGSASPGFKFLVWIAVMGA